MRTLLIDTETSPLLALTFSTFKTTIRPEQIVEPPRMLCFAYRWDGERKRTQFASEWDDGQQGMAETLHSLLNEADAVVHFNGISFDEKWARTAMLTAGLKPPSPWKSIDLYRASQKFYLPSHKLEYVATRLIPTPGKMAHSGFSLWRGVLDGDPKARNQMRRYSVQDVDVMVPVHDELKPWITGYPNVVLVDGVDGLACTRCASTNIQRRGFAYTAHSKFPRWSCNDCGAWSRETRRVAGSQMAEVR